MRAPRATVSRTVVALIMVMGAVIILAVSCSSSTDPDETAAFCNRIRAATGPLGAETTFGAGDPQRLDETIADLTELAALAPDEVDATTQRMVEIFEVVRATPRDEVRDVLADNEGEVAQLSAKLTQFTLDNCGVILQRAPATPTPLPEAVSVNE